MTENARDVVYNITGKLVALGPLRRDLISLYTDWVNDFAVMRTMGTRLAPTTLEAEEAWYNGIATSESDIAFTLYEVASGQPIGSTSLTRLSHQHRVAEFGVIIGEKGLWGKGYGTEAAALTLDYGFNALGLHCIYLRVYSYNARGLRAYGKAGFKHAGRLRQAHWLAGQAYDVIYMDCLATEFESPFLKRAFGV